MVHRLSGLYSSKMRVFDSWSVVILAIAAFSAAVESFRYGGLQMPRLQCAGYHDYKSISYTQSSNDLIMSLNEDSTRSRVDSVLKSSTALCMTNYREEVVQISPPSQFTQNLHRPLKVMGKKEYD